MSPSGVGTPEPRGNAKGKAAFRRKNLAFRRGAKQGLRGKALYSAINSRLMTAPFSRVNVALS